MLKGLFRRKMFVGLDAGSSSVKVIELSGKDDHLTLTRLGIEPLAPDTISDGQILNREEMAGAISKLFPQHHRRKQRLATAVGGYRTIIKSIVLPPMTEEELSESIDWHAEDHIPYEISDVRLGYRIIASTEDSLSVLLAACKKELIQNLEQTAAFCASTPRNPSASTYRRNYSANQMTPEVSSPNCPSHPF